MYARLLIPNRKLRMDILYQLGSMYLAPLVNPHALISWTISSNFEEANTLFL